MDEPRLQRGRRYRIGEKVIGDYVGRAVHWWEENPSGTDVVAYVFSRQGAPSFLVSAEDLPKLQQVEQDEAGFQTHVFDPDEDWV